MLSENALAQITALAEEVSAREGCRLYDLEFVGQGRGRTLRVFIDRDDEPVSIDQCANVSRGLSLLLDVEDLIPGGAYDLEVSSPGLERFLRLPWHFERAVGKVVKLKLRGPAKPKESSEPTSSGPKSLQGELMGFTGDVLTVQAQNRDWEVNLADIEKARLVFEYKKPSSQTKNKKKR